MTFLEEEFEAVEKTPHYRRVLKVLLKYQIYNLCQKLSDVGEESYVVTASVSDGTFSRLGSKKGETFLQKVHDAEWKFLSFCSGRGSDDDPQVFEEIPDQSQEEEADQFEQEVVTQTYDDGQDDLEQDPSSYESQEAPIQEMEDSNLAAAATHGPSSATPPSDDNASFDLQNIRVKQENDDDEDDPLPTKLYQNSYFGSEPSGSPEMCDGGFSGTGTLSDHDKSVLRKRLISEISMKSKKGSFQCQVCECFFDTVGHLRNHVRSHTGERPYHCTVCGKGFKQGGHLTEHMRIHTGERPHHCFVCGKNFSRRYRLKMHLKTHKELL